MSRRRRLWLLTETFPYGIAEEFIEVELPSLAAEFERVTVVPVYPVSGEPTRALPRNCACELPPVNPERSRSRFSALLRGATDTQARRWFSAERVAASLHGRRGLLRLALRAAAARRLRDWLEPRLDVPRDVVLSYWLSCGATALAMIKDQHPGLAAVSRAHGVDVYPERSDPPYLPLQGRTIAGLDFLAVISEHGRNSLTRRFPHLAPRIALRPLGVPAAIRRASPSTDGVLRVLTCSTIVGVKRLDLLVEALRLCRRPIEWTHIGGDLDGGASRGRLERAATRIREPVRWRFLGRLAHEHLYPWLAAHPVDLLVNVSESEGRPVSILEAQAHGVPVLATAVGGVPELVGEDSGWLIPSSIRPDELAARLDAIAADPSALAPLRAGALQRWRRFGDASRLFPDFARELRSMAVA